jgi:hypothetical protein
MNIDKKLSLKLEIRILLLWMAMLINAIIKLGTIIIKYELKNKENEIFISNSVSKMLLVAHKQ